MQYKKPYYQTQEFRKLAKTWEDKLGEELAPVEGLESDQDVYMGAWRYEGPTARVRVADTATYQYYQTASHVAMSELLRGERYEVAVAYALHAQGDPCKVIAKVTRRSVRTAERRVKAIKRLTCDRAAYRGPSLV